MSTLGPRPFCWNCLKDATQIPLTCDGAGNWICDPCDTEIDALITHGKDGAHLSDHIVDR